MTLALGVLDKVQTTEGAMEWRFSADHTYSGGWPPTKPTDCPFLGIYDLETGATYTAEDKPVVWSYRLDVPRDDEFISWGEWHPQGPYDLYSKKIWVRGAVTPSDASQPWYPPRPAAHAFAVFRSSEAFISREQAALMQLLVTATVGGLAVKGAGRILLGASEPNDGTYGDVAADIIDVAPEQSKFWTHFVYSYEQL